MKIDWEEYYNKSKLIDLDDMKKIEELAINIHFEKFGVKPKIVDGYKKYKHDVIFGIIDSIMYETKPYDEYLDFTEEEQQLIKNGGLIF